MQNKLETILKLSGKVLKNLSNGFYQVLLENKKVIIASTSGKMRKRSVKILVGDTVDLEISIYDFTKGRIVRRY